MSGETHDDQTMDTVRTALVNSGQTLEGALASINSMQNAGILFREIAVREAPMFTRHNHHIPGTGWENPPSTGGSLCGGPRHCADCKTDVEAINKPPMVNWPEDARQLLKRHLDRFGHAGEEFDIYIVWACKVLQNWNGMLSTTLPDGMYYELTYDGDKRTWYVDDYPKARNTVYKISPEIVAIPPTS